MKFLTPIILLLFGSSGLVNAQLCSGSLGDPVVHIDFGRGSGIPPALKAASTTYSYVRTDCPGDGFYTVNNFTTNCFNNTWHSLIEDHTPNDAGGYFMLVNASFVPGDFFVDTVRGLCKNTTYEFAAWVTNVLKPIVPCGAGIDPNLTFTIETLGGTVLARQNSGDISESGVATWKQYGVFFKTPANLAEVIVRITNNAPGGCGNDLALDDITFRPCGPVVNAVISSTGKDSAMFCEGASNSLTLTSNYAGGYSNPSFQWQESTDTGVTWKNIPGATGLSFTRPSTTGTGSFQYKMLIGESSDFGIPSCRTASNIIRVNIFPLPILNFKPAVNGCENSTFQLSVSGASAYNWTGPNGFTASSSTVTFSPLKMNQAGRYSVAAISDKGCPASGATDLSVFPGVTSVVTPDLTICEGSSTALTATGGSKYQWTPAKGLSDPTIANPTAQPIDSTKYRVIVENQYGCKDTGRVAVNIWKKPLANAGPDKRTRAGTPVQLDGAASGFDVSYSWTPSGLSDAAALTPLATPAQTTTYTLSVVSAVGCGTSRDDMVVRVYDIPNAFSPNGDGVNDLWAIKSADAFANSVIEVFNRYGQVVFSSKGYSNPWNGNYNGKPVPSGTYYYVIDLKSGTEPNITGWVFLVR